MQLVQWQASKQESEQPEFNSCFISSNSRPVLADRTFCDDDTFYIGAVQYGSHELHMAPEHLKCG